MNTFTINTLEDFDEKIKELELYVANLKLKEGAIYVSDLLFRGQADSDWALETTLERATNKDSKISFATYRNQVKEAASVLILKKIKTRIELPIDFKIDFSSGINKAEGSLQWITFMAYLRHHGYPSPLLDWTTEINVALYFAFNPFPTKEYVSIYAFVEHTGNGHSVIASHQANIRGIGPNLRAHNECFRSAE